MNRKPAMNATDLNAKVSSITKSLEFYANLKYPVRAVNYESIAIAWHPHLPGCAAYGADLPQALIRLEEARYLWTESRLIAGQEVPEP